MQRTYLTSLLACIVVSVFVNCGQAPSVDSDEHLWQKGELLAGEDFSGDLSGWLVEGSVVASIEDGRLRFEATEQTETKKGNIWLRKHFSGPVRIEYDYQSATEHGLSMIWWHAHGRKGEDLFSWERDGSYEPYVSGRLNGYHISYHRFGSGASNFRKAHGFHMVATAVDPIPASDLNTHHIVIYSRDGHNRFLVDGKLVHDFHDEGKPCLEGDAWVHEFPCQGTGLALTEGKIGIRHTQRQVAYYDNFKVYRLVKP